MLLKAKEHTSENVIRAGLLCFLAGILIQRLLEHEGFLKAITSTARQADFLNGFADGFALALIASSIVLQLWGLSLRGRR